MQVEARAPASPSSIFNIRHNWSHLTRRPLFQEPVIDGVRAIAVLWVAVLHMIVILTRRVRISVVAFRSSSGLQPAARGT